MVDPHNTQNNTDETPRMLDVLMDLHPFLYFSDINAVLDAFAAYSQYLADDYREDRQSQLHEIGRDRMWQEMAGALNSATFRALAAVVSWQPFVERFEQTEDLRKKKEAAISNDLLDETMEEILEELYNEYSLCTLLDALQAECRWIADDIDEGELPEALAGHAVSWRTVADALEPLVLRAEKIDASWKTGERTDQI